MTECRWLGKVDRRKPYPRISVHVQQHIWYYVTSGFPRWMLEPNTSLSNVYEVVVFIHNRNLSYTEFSNICKCYWSVFYPTLVERMMALAVMTLSKLNNEFPCLFCTFSANYCWTPAKGNTFLIFAASLLCVCNLASITSSPVTCTKMLMLGWDLSGQLGLVTGDGILFMAWSPVWIWTGLVIIWF